MFRFRLQKVLRHRQRIVDAEARKLQAIEATAARLERENERLAAEVAAAGRRVADAGGFDLVQHRRLTDFAAGRRRRIRSNAAQAARIRVDAEKQRQVLLAAQRAKRVLEQLRERQRIQWEREELRRVQKQIDEIAAMSYGTEP